MVGVNEKEKLVEEEALVLLIQNTLIFKKKKL
jgi:hypothetical protein